MLFQIKTINGQKTIVPLTADTGTGAPVGSLIAMYKKSSPSGYLYCDGSTFDETKYPALYQYLGSNVLPDYREFALVGAEQNTTDVYNASTNPTGTIHDHDVYTEGQAKDDQLQNIEFNMSPEGPASNSLVYGSDTQGFSNLQNIVRTGARVGTVTRGKRKAVYFYIKATSGLTENQQENVLNTINENLSYSTTEHKTGKKWIDGKDVYSKTIDFGYLPNNIAVTKQNVLSNVDTVVSLQGMGIRPTEGQITIPYLDISEGTTYMVNLFMPSKTSVRISTNFMAVEYYGYVTVEYTKTTD